ncbi:DUF1877 family protein [Kallotenue papyrolyticum]|uniref:DUF1877 family protein n=1 Tax=Kallotenue papyrolyticum TaxID=1325125 RepID=UPI0009DE4CF6|nr:DUF1877 family protein [Kallotenue papyrolyticum]
MGIEAHFLRVRSRDLDNLLACNSADRVTSVLQSSNIESPDEIREFNLGKMFGSVNSLLAPHFDIVEGGTVLVEDWVIGSLRFLRPKEVRKLAEAMSIVSEMELQQNFNTREGIGNRTHSDEEEQWFRSTLYFYNRLRDFLKDAAQAGDAVLLWLA